MVANGAPLNVMATVRNGGRGAAGASVVSFYLSTDARKSDR